MSVRRAIWLTSLGGATLVVGAHFAAAGIVDIMQDRDAWRAQALRPRPPAATAQPTPGPTTSPRPSESPSPSREPDSGGPGLPPGLVVADPERAPESGAGGRGDPPSGGGGGAAPAPDPPDAPGPTDPGDPPPSGDGCPAGLVRAEVTLGARVCLTVGR